MKRDQLFLLKHDFSDKGKTYYCPGCAELVGVLEFYPKLKQRLEVHHIGFQRPRPELVPLLGEANQSCPVLVLGEEPKNLPENLALRRANGRAFVEGAREIGEYLAHAYGIALPH